MKVLVTGGAVFGQLDDNKILSNLARGKWAAELCDFLLTYDHQVSRLSSMEFWAYKRRCTEEAANVDAAVMAAAVLNYIPEKPYVGKMPTDLDRVDIRLIKSPYVIDEMRKINPRLKLIGCKLTSRESIESTIEKAQQLILRSKAHAVVANDKQNLRLKMLCFPDGAVIKFDDDFNGLYEEIKSMITDEHFHTVKSPNTEVPPPHVTAAMDGIINRYRDALPGNFAGKTQFFGSIAVRCGWDMLVTPRVKSDFLSSSECSIAKVNLDKREVVTFGNKVTINAPLLWSMLASYPVAAVIHLHEELPGLETLDYAPPGTVRDSIRGCVPMAFNIRGHGFVACVNRYGEILGL